MLGRTILNIPEQPQRLVALQSAPGASQMALLRPLDAMLKRVMRLPRGLTDNKRPFGNSLVIKFLIFAVKSFQIIFFSNTSLHFIMKYRRTNSD